MGPSMASPVTGQRNPSPEHDFKLLLFFFLYAHDQFVRYIFFIHHNGVAIVLLLFFAKEASMEEEKMTLSEAREEALSRAYSDYLNAVDAKDANEALEAIKTLESLYAKENEIEAENARHELDIEIENKKIELEESRQALDKKQGVLKAAVDLIHSGCSLVSTFGVIHASNKQLKSVELFEETGCFTSESNKRRLSLPNVGGLFKK